MNRLLTIALIALGLGALVGLSLLTAVCLCAHRDFESRPSDCLVVLGAHVWMDGRMSDALTYRCEAALAAWRDGLAPAIIVCGGQGDNEPAPEARVMRAWFARNGVPESALFADETSENTRQNLRNARAIMADQGFETAAICTSDYHLTRALWLARDEGLDACGVAAPSTRGAVSFARGRLREACSWLLYILRQI